MALLPQLTMAVSHLDPELGAWSALEYRAIARESTQTGCRFVVCSVSPAIDLSELNSSRDSETKTTVETTTQSEEDLFSTEIAAGRVCLLDPRASADLSPQDKDKFCVFLFGGILGDDPPRDRTAELRKKGFPGRRLGPKQMTTDTAVRVTRLVLQTGQKLDQLPYVDSPELKMNQHESTEMPFRYLADGHGNPVMPDGMLELIRKDADKAFDDFD